MWVPYPDAGIQASSCNSLAIESNSVNLAEMPLQGTQALPAGDAPDLGGGIVASGYDKVAMNFQAAYAGLVPH